MNNPTDLIQMPSPAFPNQQQRYTAFATPARAEQPAIRSETHTCQYPIPNISIKCRFVNLVVRPFVPHISSRQLAQRPVDGR